MIQTTSAPGVNSADRAASRPFATVGEPLLLEDVRAVALEGVGGRLATAARDRMLASRTVVDRITKSGTAAYGITTGFGALSDRGIPPALTRQLQVNLLVSDAAGVGEPFPTEIVRAALLLRAQSLARGVSGVRPDVVERLLDLLNHGIHPVVPSQGSLGASGDLAPLAHLTLPLIGMGQVEDGGQVIGSAQALAAHGLAPLELESKEALSLINGTQIMAAIGALTLLAAERLLDSAVTIASLSYCALAARRAPLDARIHAARPHPGQQAVAAHMRGLLAPVPEPPPSSGGRIQDPYSLRCVPQVYGAVRDALRPVRATLEIEINAATDNPLVFPHEDAVSEDTEAASLLGDVVSAGNFHGHPLALAFDAAKIAIASLGTIVERRINLLVDGEARGLPPFLVAEPGLNCGFMIPHYVSAGLVAENRVLAHPSSVDSIPTSANIEDYNSMGATAGRHFRQVTANVETIVAIEALAAAQGCDLAGRVPSGPLGEVYRRIRERVPFLERDDRIPATDIAAALTLLREGGLTTSLHAEEA